MLQATLDGMQPRKTPDKATVRQQGAIELVQTRSTHTATSVTAFSELCNSSKTVSQRLSPHSMSSC